MFENLFGKKDKEPAPRHPNLPNPLNLRLGAAIQFDSILTKVLGASGNYLLEFPESGSIHMVVAQGEVDLGQGAKLSRFYLKDDYWIQVKRSGSDVEAGVDEIHLFGFGDVFHPSSQEEFEEFSKGFGLTTYSYAEKTFQRVWGGQSHQLAAAEYSERVYPADDASYGTAHQDILYSRAVDGGREELLLVSIETDDDGDVNVVHSVGISVSTSDFQVT